MDSLRENMWIAAVRTRNLTNCAECRRTDLEFQRNQTTRKKKFQHQQIPTTASNYMQKKRDSALTQIIPNIYCSLKKNSKKLVLLELPSFKQKQSKSFNIQADLGYKIVFNLNSLFKSQLLSLRTKMKLYKTLILPIYLWM